MDAAAYALGTAAVTVSLAGAVGYGLYRLVNVSEPKSAFDYARKWLAWGLALASIVQLPKFFHHLDVNSFAVWVLLVAVVGSVAFLLGWLYGRFFTTSLPSLTPVVIRDLKTSIGKTKQVTTSKQTAQSSPETLTGSIDDQFYEIAWVELETEKIDKGLWAKSFTEAEGDIEKTKVAYLKNRVRKLQASKEKELTLQEIHQPQQEKIDGYDDNGHTPLMRAVKAMDVAAVINLIDKGANPKIRDGNFGTSTALSIAKLGLKRATTPVEQEGFLKIVGFLEPIT